MRFAAYRSELEVFSRRGWFSSVTPLACCLTWANIWTDWGGWNFAAWRHSPQLLPEFGSRSFTFFFFPLAGIWTSGIFPRKRGKPRRLTFCSLGSGVRDRSCWIGRSWICEGGEGGKATFACGSSSFSPVLFACWRNFAGTRSGFTMRAWTRPVPVLGEDINKTNSSLAAGCCLVMHWKLGRRFVPPRFA